jgi:hypothetical protein
MHALAHDLAIAHPSLGTTDVWLRVIAAAAHGSNGALEVLCGTALADRALALISRLRAEREHAPRRGRACDGDAPNAIRLSRSSDHDSQIRTTTPGA